MSNPQMPSQNQGVSVPSSGPQQWNNSLFGCFSDIGSCFCGLCFPCIQYGKNYEAVHKQGCGGQAVCFVLLSYIGLPCLIHKDLRGDIRRKYNLDEGCGDCLTTFCCSRCAICQEARELKSRGAMN